MRLDTPTALFARLLLVAALTTLPPLAIAVRQAFPLLRGGLEAELERKASAIGRLLALRAERALARGLPFDQGMGDGFEAVLADNPDIRYLAVTSPMGEVVALRGAERHLLSGFYRSAAADPVAGGVHRAETGPFIDLALPIREGDAVAGQVHVGTGRDDATRRLLGILADAGAAVLAVLVVALEVLLFGVVVVVSAPLARVAGMVERGRRGDFPPVAANGSADEVGALLARLGSARRKLEQAHHHLIALIDEVRTGHFDRVVAADAEAIARRVRYLFRFGPADRPPAPDRTSGADARLLLFLLVLAEALSRSFLPLYAGRLAPLPSALAPEIWIALPLAAFGLALVLGSLGAGPAVLRLGSRRLLLIGLVPAVTGAAFSAVAGDVVHLAAWRAVTGLGYALMLAACHHHADRAGAGEGPSDGGGLIRAALGAGIAALPLGGVLAEWTGFAAPFLLSAGLVALAGLLLGRLTVAGDGKEVSAPRGGMASLFCNWRLDALLLFALIPARMVPAGFLLFLVPLQLWQGGWSLPAIGWLMAVYPLVALPVSAWGSRWADRPRRRAALVALGGSIAAAALLSGLRLEGEAALVVGIVGLAVAQGMTVAPGRALVPDICWIECRRRGRTRVLALVGALEWVGMALGPPLAAGLLSARGGAGAMVGLGVVAGIFALLFMMLAGAYGPGPHLVTEEEDQS